MQFTMQLFEVNTQGFAGPSSMQRVAVKMPTDGQFSCADGNSGFADIMAAFFRMPAEQLEASLANMETLEMGEASTEWVPVIDLAKLVDDKAAMFSLEGVKVEEEGDAINPDMDAELDLDEAAVSKMISGLLGQGESDADEPFVSGDLTFEGAGRDSALRQRAMKWMVDRMTEQMGEGKEAESGEIELPLQNSGLFKQMVQAEQGHGRPGTDESALAQAQAKPVANNVSGKSPVVNGALADQVENEAITADDGATFEAAARKAANAGTEGQKKGFADMAPQAGSKEAVPQSQQKVADEPILGDVELKQRIRPGDSGEKAAPLTNNAGQGLSSGAAGATTTIDGQQPFSVPSPEVSDGKMTVHTKEESGELPSGSKEMETDIVRQIVQRMSLRSDGRQSQMQIRLKPEFLGNLRMDVITENRLVMVRMTAESQSVKEMIEQNIGLLKTELQQQGLQVQKVDVTVSQNNDQWAGGQQQTAFEQAQHRSGQRQGNRRPGGEASGRDGEGIQKRSAPEATQSKTSEVDFFA